MARNMAPQTAVAAVPYLVGAEAWDVYEPWFPEGWRVLAALKEISLGAALGMVLAGIIAAGFFI